MPLILSDTNFNYPQEIINYNKIKDFAPFIKNEMEPIMCYLNKFNIKNFFKVYKQRDLLDNKFPASKLNYSDIGKDGFYSTDNNHNYLRYDHNSYIPFDFALEDVELSDIRSQRCLLRVNKEKNVVYTVRKTHGVCGKPEYVFRSFLLVMNNGNPKDIRAILQSHCCVEEVPDISFFRNDIKVGISTLDDVIQRIPDTKFSSNEDKGYSFYACADKYSTTIYVSYSKKSDGKFYVDEIRWESEGYNILPYLLPIDRQLIDPNYTLPEEIKGEEDNCCNIM